MASAKGKVTLRRKKPDRVVERNAQLTGHFMRYLLERPGLFDSLPDRFELVILPEDDRELRQYNLDLLDAFGSEGRPIVFVRIKSSEDLDLKSARPQVYAPVAA
jgi:hypothetical protein